MRLLALLLPSLLLAGCGLTGDACELPEDPEVPVCAEPAPSGGAGPRLEPIPSERSLEGTVTQVRADGFAIAGPRRLTFDVVWPGGVPFPLAPGDRVELLTEQANQRVRAPAGELWLYREAYGWGRPGPLPLDETTGIEFVPAGCRDEGGVERVDLAIRGPSTATIAAGEHAQVGPWTVHHDGGSYATPVEGCGVVGEGFFAATAWAWRAHDADCASVEPPTPDCPASVEAANRSLPAGGARFGLLGIDASTLPQTFRVDAVNEGILSLVGPGGRSVEFVHPIAWPIELAAGEEVEIDAQAGWSILRTATDEVAVFVHEGFSLPEVAALDGMPPLRLDEACNGVNGRSAARLHLGEDVLLEPGSAVTWGDWRIEMLAAYHLPGSSCGGHVVEGYGVAVIAAHRALATP